MKDTKLTNEALVLLATQMEMLLEAGIPLSDGFSSIALQYEKTPWEPYMMQLKEDIEGGLVYEAMERCPCIPSSFWKMVKVGEISGNLDVVMKRLALYYQQLADIEQLLTQSVRYPTILMGMMSAILALFLLTILPTFEQVYASLGQNVTHGAIRSASVLALVSLSVMVIVAIVGYGLYFDVRYHQGHIWNRVSKHIPWIKRYRQNAQTSRLCFVLAMMMDAGMDFEQAIQTGMDTQEEEHKVLLQSLLDSMSTGASFVDSLERLGLFEPFHMKMIATADQSGQLSKVFHQLQEIYGNKAQHQLDFLLSMMEPLIVGVMTVIVGMILVVVMLPLVNILSTMM